MHLIIKLFNNIYRLWSIRKRINIIFSRLENKDIMLFDSNRSDSLIKYLDLDINNVSITHIDYKIYLDFHFILTLIVNIFNYKNFKPLGNVNLLSVIYFCSLIRVVNPKIVISFSDLSDIYSAVMKNIKDIHFIAIANGPRAHYMLKIACLHVNNYYVLGNEESVKMDLYPNITVDNLYALGSISLGYHKKSVIGLQTKYDICVISQLPNLFNAYCDKKRSIGVLDTILLADQYILEYVSVNELKLCIQLRTNLKDEIDYYKYKYGESVDLIPRKDSSYYTYKTIAQSKLVIGFNSTCIMEAWALGKKGLLVDFSGINSYNTVKEKYLIAKDPNSAAFKKHLKITLAMSMREYINKTGRLTRNYIANDDNHQPHEVIKAKINKLLN
jgi:surface carbohydrate biosynthesis protein